MKTIKNQLLLASAFLFIFMNNTYAQPGKNNPEGKILSLKIAVFTRIMDLTPQEAKDFWPLYNEYQDELLDLNYDEKKYIAKLQNKMTEITEDDYKAAIENHFKIEQKRLDLTSEYYKKYQDVLSYEKIFLIQKAERTFKKELLNRIKKQQQGKRMEIR